jgi:hypothetical protein
MNLSLLFQERAKEIEEELMSLNRSSSPDVQAQVITQLTPPSILQ